MVKGKIVLCRRGVVRSSEKAMAVVEAGGVALVIYSTVDSVNYLLSPDCDIPAVVLPYSPGGLTALKYASSKNPIGYLTKGRTLAGPTKVEAPDVAAFSSPGPNGGCFVVLKVSGRSTVIPWEVSFDSLIPPLSSLMWLLLEWILWLLFPQETTLPGLFIAVRSTST